MNQQQAFILALVVASGLASLLIVLPFIEYVLAALIFAYVLYPPYRLVEPYLGRRFAPIAIIFTGMMIVALPIAYILLILFRDLQAIAAGETDLDVAEIEIRIEELTGEEFDLAVATEEVAQTVGELLFGSVTEMVTFSLKASLGIALVLFLIYYTLRDGPQFVEWITSVTPLDDAMTQRLVVQIDRTTWGVVMGHLFVAVVQGIVGGFGLYIAGFPNVAFWTFVMIVLSLLPLIGAFLVWGPAAVYLYIIQEPTMAAFLAIWGLAVVSMIDNYARPIVIDQRAHLNPGVILVGVFGGIYAIGFTGLFVGPIVIGVFAATLTAFRDEVNQTQGNSNNSRLVGPTLSFSDVIPATQDTDEES